MEPTKIWDAFQGTPLISFATSVDNQPRVRIMALICSQNALWVCTPGERTKVSELNLNPLFEFVMPLKGEKDTGSLRVAGAAEMIHDYSIKTLVSKDIPFFTGYWKNPEDSNFVLYQLNVATVRVHDPEDKKFYTHPFSDIVPY